jgi:hypothetical protein
VLLAAAALPAQDSRPAPRLRRVEVATRDVFGEEARTNPFYALIDVLHGTTDPEVVRRELWLRPGDPITAADVLEIERVLRATRLFAEVEARTRDAGAGKADLLVDTSDRFTLAVQAGISRVGGVEKFSGQLSEWNLFGTGKRVTAAVRETEDEHRRWLEYNDPQLLGTWHQLRARVDTTDEGDGWVLGVARPFHHLLDPWSYGVEVEHLEHRRDWFDLGETVAEVPERRGELRAFVAAGAGPRQTRTAAGADLRARLCEYDPPVGAQAGAQRAAPDVREVQLGPTWRIDHHARYVERSGIDAIDYVEDLALGAGAGVRAAGAWRDLHGREPRVQPVLEVDGWLALEPWPDTYLTAEARAGVRAGRDGVAGWRTSCALHAYQCSLPAQTLAASLTFDAAGEREELLPQFTLGEDNGLRGYPARELAGPRMLRCNLEDRIRTGIQFLSLHVGIAVFTDFGAVHDPRHDLGLDDLFHAAGVGLRFGSRRLLGSRVLRLDVAWPFDDLDGDRFGVSVSFGGGQVFTFFGNNSELGGL